MNDLEREALVANRMALICFVAAVLAALSLLAVYLESDKATYCGDRNHGYGYEFYKIC